MTRKLPSILALAFIAITLTRVGEFAASRMGGGWPGWAFSVALGVGVYMAAYWTRDSITAKDGKEDRRSATVKQWSFGLLAFFVGVDGLFNLAEVWATVKPPVDDILLIASTIVYGVFPTLAAGGLGALQGHIDRLPTPPVNARTNIVAALKRRLVSVIDQGTQQGATGVAKISENAQQHAIGVAEIGNREKAIMLKTENPELTQEEIAKQIGVSRQRVSVYLARSLAQANGKVKEGKHE